MKFSKFQKCITWNYVFIIPSIVISRNEPMYYAMNFAIEIHWLWFHIRWLWVDEEY